MRTFYLIVTVAGIAIPGVFVVAFVSQHGPDIPLLIRESFANAAAGAFTADVLVSSVIFWGFAYYESRKYGIRRFWVYGAANIVGGLSVGLPLFLYARQKKIDALS
ncbi:MAG: DUF2834 domain-containing protein [candidate division Zixibacteria bacterium]|nr:DUF2834 domain-containing protein [candidate division Zixibacteria bacterium]